MRRFSKPFPLAELSTLLSILLLLVGCGAQQQNATSADPSTVDPGESVPSGSPTLEELADATYSGIEEEPIQLVDGLWEGEPLMEGGASAPRAGLVRDFQITGDIDGDGRSETVGLLWSSSGGSGTFDYVAVVGRDPEGITVLDTAELGDRVQVRAGRVASGRIELDVVQAGPEDAACCPTQMATRTWELVAEGLVEAPAEITGTLSLDALRGPEWVLADFAWNEPAPADPEVTLIFDADKAAGNAGCNGYFASAEENGEMPTSLSFGAIGATRMMCPEGVMAVEDRYFKQLAGVSSYGFLAGKLALAWDGEGAGGVMLFSPRTPAPPAS